MSTHPQARIRTAIVAGGTTLVTAVSLAASLALAPAPASAPPAPLPACQVEDASYGPSPCLWDAQRQGNGEGRTVVVVRDGN